MTSIPVRPVRPRTASLPFRNSHAAKTDAVQWTNQRNLRIVLEHLTSALLEAKPDDPLVFIREFLEDRKESEETGGFVPFRGGARDAGMEGEGGGQRPSTSASSSTGRPGTGRGEQTLERMRGECTHWETLYAEQNQEAAKLESEIKKLEAALEATATEEAA